MKFTANDLEESLKSHTADISRNGAPVTEEIPAVAERMHGELSEKGKSGPAR